MNCLLCGNTHRTFLFAVKDFFSQYRFAVVECETCSFAETIVPEGTQSYPSSYHGVPGKRFGGLFECVSKLFYSLRAKRIAGGPGVLVDVGSGQGDFLQQMSGRGWHCTGVERESDGSVLSSTEFLGERIPAESVDYITFWHSLEHLPNGELFLNAAHRVLKTSGRLLIEVPNFKSFQSWWAGKNWLHLDCPRHRWHFNAKTLHGLLKRHGFAIETTSSFSWDVGIFGNLQAWLDHFCLSRNFLYRVLQPACRHEMKRPMMWMDALLSMALVPLFLPLAFSTEVVASCFGGGGVVRVMARKADA